MAAPLGGLPESMNEFTRLEQFVNLQKPPTIKFPDLEAQVDSRITYNILPMKVRVDFFPITDASVMTYVTVQFDNKDLQLKNKDGVSTANIHLVRRIHHDQPQDRADLRGRYGNRRRPEAVSRPIGRSTSSDRPEGRAPEGRAPTAWW